MRGAALQQRNHVLAVCVRAAAAVHPATHLCTMTQDIYLFASEQQGAAQPGSGRSAAAASGGRASSPSKRSRAGAHSIDAAVPSSAKSSDNRNGDAEHRPVSDAAAAAADERRQDATGQQEADGRQADSAASPPASMAASLQAGRSASGAAATSASASASAAAPAGSQAPGLPEGFVGPPPSPPPGDPPASSGTQLILFCGPHRLKIPL